MVVTFAMNAIWLLFAVVISGYYLYSKRHGTNLPPGPMGLPLVGYVPFLGRHPASTLCNLSKKYGPIISIKLGRRRAVVLNDYDAIQEALVKRGDVFSGRPKLFLMDKIKKGFGIVFRNFDTEYKSQKKFAMITLREFGLGKRSMEDRITEELEYFTQLLEAQNGQSFNFRRVLSTSVSNVMCSIAMGSRFPYDDIIFREMVDQLIRRMSGKDAIYYNLLLFAPVLRFFPLFSRTYKKELENSNYVVGILRHILEEHKKTLDFENSRDYIDEFLNEMHRNKFSDPSFNEYQLLETIRDLFVAGTETTSETLRWCILLIAHQPDIQQKLYEEVKEVIGDATPAMKFKEKMPYTAAFLHEISRHRTLIPLSLPHAVTQDVSFRGYHIPKGTTIMPNVWAVHNNPGYFEYPNEFLPERFLNENGSFVPDKHVIPFSVGPRYCLGKHLADMELFLFVINIIRRFRIAADPKKPLPDFNNSIAGIVEVSLPYEVSFKSRN